MIELRQIATAPGFSFDTLVAGDPGAPLVMLLHGFAESFHMWRAQLPELAAAKFCAVAPSQRGYSPGARPDPLVFANYEFDRLVADAMAIADVFARDQGFHLVGHDWGGSLAWAIADRAPERLASLTILSRPHPIAFNRALEMPDGEQKRRSSHHRWFLEDDAVARLLADDTRWLRERHKANGMPLEASERHLKVIGNEGAMTAALAWYRARGTHHKPVGVTQVPTLYIWGDADDTVGRADQFPAQVNDLLRQHLAQHPA
jgi:pimeloyl-ACP methyl ester carboxylesterase